MLHVFKGEILANMTQVSDVAPGPLVILKYTPLVAMIHASDITDHSYAQLLDQLYDAN
jgi:hypothetical protein